MEFLSLIGGCTGSSESTLVKIPHCWKSHVTVNDKHMFLVSKRSISRKRFFYASKAYVIIDRY